MLSFSATAANLERISFWAGASSLYKHVDHPDALALPSWMSLLRWCPDTIRSRWYSARLRTSIIRLQAAIAVAIAVMTFISALQTLFDCYPEAQHVLTEWIETSHDKVGEWRGSYLEAVLARNHFLFAIAFPIAFPALMGLLSLVGLIQRLLHLCLGVLRTGGKVHAFIRVLCGRSPQLLTKVLHVIRCCCKPPGEPRSNKGTFIAKAVAVFTGIKGVVARIAMPQVFARMWKAVQNFTSQLPLVTGLWRLVTNVLKCIFCGMCCRQAFVETTASGSAASTDAAAASAMTAFSLSAAEETLPRSAASESGQLSAEGGDAPDRQQHATSGAGAMPVQRASSNDDRPRSPGGSRGRAAGSQATQRKGRRYITVA